MGSKTGFEKKLTLQLMTETVTKIYTETVENFAKYT